MNYGVYRRCGLNLSLLWLWYRPAATAPIRPLAWEPPYAVDVAVEKAKRPKKKKNCANHTVQTYCKAIVIKTVWCW